ncbi:hypothetical protein K504DRAFT_53011 [Pleomassaria siparia CBS 279.74]|uniref:Uncharacterized protein n=1 Tax=Pleomassaria siparia CBS 279.74 TaxID=1314801 RepID=A0A6G1K3R0_9PLEO|nr:hypothetical protein K504DRAFT_53011 [Pleomassaria siparia CBS 279.74]
MLVVKSMYKGTINRTCIRNCIEYYTRPVTHPLAPFLFSFFLFFFFDIKSVGEAFRHPQREPHLHMCATLQFPCRIYVHTKHKAKAATVSQKKV